MSDRCDLTDLLVSDCAHCRGLDKPVERRDLGPWFTAHYPGECSDCGAEFEPGDRIRADGEGGWLAPCCGEQPARSDGDTFEGLIAP